MITKFTNKTISSVLTVFPQQEIDFMDEMNNYNYSELKMKKLKKLMGYNTRRCGKKGEGVSDYAIFGVQHLIDQQIIKVEDVGAIIVTSTSPDYFIPPTSNLIQGHFNISHDCVCIDVSQGCCGYSVGLTYAFMTLEHLAADKKVLLVCGDRTRVSMGWRSISLLVATSCRVLQKPLLKWRTRQATGAVRSSSSWRATWCLTLSSTKHLS